MVKTKELYYENAYTEEFDATVLSCTEGKNGTFFVVLDKTAFFPEQGGQSSDTGILKTSDGKEIKVTHTSIRDGVISHVTNESVAEGTKVSGKIDFFHRFSNMQQHTGEHIFSGIVHSKYGYENVGFHLSDNEVTMDYNGPLTADELKEIELKVNEAIWKNVPVKCEFPTDEELAGIDYRSKKELSGAIRIVTVEGYDICACCAPHVERTGEIGILKVVGFQSYKGGVRVSILCGKRALEYIGYMCSVTEDTSRFLTTGSDKVFSAVKKLSEENHELRGKLSTVTDKLMEIELAAIDESLENVFLQRDKDMDGNSMRKLVNSLSEKHEGFCGVFSGEPQKGYKYIIASGSAGRDATGLQKMLKEEFSARGGDSKAMVQGSLMGISIEDVIARCESFS